MKTEFLVLHRDLAVNGALSGAASGAALGSVVPGFGTLIGGVIGAGVGLFSGLSQKKKAAQMAKNNPYPYQGVPQAELDNQQMAKQAANEGLPGQQYQQAMNSIGQQQNNAINAAKDRHSGSGLISQIVQGGNDAKLKLNVANANARISNQRALYGINKGVAGYQQSAFDWNSKNKYNQDYNYQQQLQGAGNANIVGGIDKLAATGMYADAAGLFGKPRRSAGISGGGGLGSGLNGISSPGAYSAVGNSVGAPPSSGMNLSFNY